MARAPGNGRAVARHINGRMRCRKRLIICFDGTWNNADNGGNPTNVVRIARAIPSVGADGIPQIVYYEPGVGTGIFDKYIGGVFGRGLEQNVKNGYLFLAHNYCGRDEVYAADEIYVFGFSRGAYTARSLCGFIGACKGLLKPRSLHKLERAWKFYRTKPEKRNKFEHYEEIEQAVHTDVTINCLGIWDTVGALGVPSTAFQMFNRRRYAFHDTEISRLVRHAFHAVAIDEKRSPFVPALWQRPKQNIPDQIVEQVWFPGVHSNVGGSYPDTDIADLTLRWMLARIACHTDLSFDPNVMDYLVPEKRKHADAAAVQRVRDKWVGAIYESRSAPYLRDRLFPTLRIVAGQRPSKQSGWGRLYPASDGIVRAERALERDRAIFSMAGGGHRAVQPAQSGLGVARNPKETREGRHVRERAGARDALGRPFGPTHDGRGGFPDPAGGDDLPTQRTGDRPRRWS